MKWPQLGRQPARVPSRIGFQDALQPVILGPGGGFHAFWTCAVRWHGSSLGWRVDKCKSIAPETRRSHRCGSAPAATTTSSRRFMPSSTSHAPAPASHHPGGGSQTLGCGDLARGFARIRCDHCGSTNTCWPSPARAAGSVLSCHQTVQTTARFILNQVVAPVAHRHYVLAIPRMLRPYPQRHRHLLKRLCTLANESLTEYLRAALDCPQGVPGIIMTLHTFGEYLDFHPHIHALVADGLFLRPASNAGSSQNPDPQPSTPSPQLPPRARRPAQPSGRTLPRQGHQPLGRAKTPAGGDTSRFLYSWKHSGFNVHAGKRVRPRPRPTSKTWPSTSCATPSRWKR